MPVRWFTSATWASIASWWGERPSSNSRFSTKAVPSVAAALTPNPQPRGKRRFENDRQRLWRQLFKHLPHRRNLDRLAVEHDLMPGRHSYRRGDTPIQAKRQPARDRLLLRRPEHGQEKPGDAGRGKRNRRGCHVSIGLPVGVWGSCSATLNTVYPCSGPHQASLRESSGTGAGGQVAKTWLSHNAPRTPGARRRSDRSSHLRRGLIFTVEIARIRICGDGVRPQLPRPVRRTAADDPYRKAFLRVGRPSGQNLREPSRRFFLARRPGP